MAWIEIHDTILDHPKTIKLATDLGVKPVQVAGHLIALFTWAIRFKPGGRLTNMDKSDIAIAARWESDAPAFVDALVNRRWLDKAGGKVPTLKIHGWEDYTRGFQKAKKDRDRKRARKFRGTSEEIPRKVAVDQTRPNQTRPNLTKPSEGAAKSEPIDSIDFKLWQTWQNSGGVPINQKSGTQAIRRAIARNAKPAEIESLFFNGEACRDNKIWDVLASKWPEPKPEVDYRFENGLTPVQEARRRFLQGGNK